MKIAVLTFHRAFNCGAMLQAWALQTTLERMGHNVRFPDVTSVGVRRFFRPLVIKCDGLIGRFRNICGWLYVNYLSFGLDFLRSRAFTAFCDRFIHHGSEGDPSLRHYDLVVVGSDQVWNPLIAGKQNFSYFLGDGVDVHVPIIGYALSGGDRMEAGESTDAIRKAARNRFRSVSYREDILRKTIGVEGPLVCDPTILLRHEDYRQLECPERLEQGEYLFAYAVNNADAILPAAKALAEVLGVKLIVADVYRPYWRLFKGMIKNDCWALSPDRMLAYIRDAKYVIASSFHGCAFSVIYQKQFLSLYREDDGSGSRKEGRQQTLLSSLGISERAVSTGLTIRELANRITRPYNCAEKMEILRTSGLEYLKSSVY